MDPRVPPSVEPMPEKQITEAEMSTEHFRQEEQKENIMQQKISTAPPVPSGRIHGSPMSPVMINQSQGQFPEPSTAQFEDGKPQAQRNSNAETLLENNYSHNSAEVVMQDMPYRQNYTTRIARPRRQQQVAVFSSAGSTKSNSFHSELSQDQGDSGGDLSSASSTNVGISAAVPVVPRLQYHHEQQYLDDSRIQPDGRREPELADRAPKSINPHPSPYVAESGAEINRHLTPNSHYGPRSAITRPMSTYSALSELGSKDRSQGHHSQSPSWTARAPSANSTGHSPDSRPNSYIDLINMPYPQVAPGTLSLDNSQLRASVGTNASLLSTAKTLEMYRLNLKKTNDPTLQYSFAIFLIGIARDQQALENEGKSSNTTDPSVETVKPQDLIKEARHILQKLSDRSYPFAQYILADGYASSFFNNGKPDNDRAFPLFVAASKHGHAEAGYRAALCYEFGWGCKKDPAKAVQFYRQSASKNHPGSMTRLGRACLTGDLGLNKYKEGVTWLKRATEAADLRYNAAPYHLGLLYETGFGDDIFKDETYAAQLFTQAADLGHSEANFRMGDAYEHGKLLCPRDPALSVHFYTSSAQQGHAEAMMALCAWYMVGAEPVLSKDESEAYEWARRAAETGKGSFLFENWRHCSINSTKNTLVLGFVKAQYAVGFFMEFGIGTRCDPLEANVWYVQAADAGDERARYRLAAIREAASGGNPDIAAQRKAKTKQECVMM